MNYPDIYQAHLYMGDVPLLQTKSGQYALTSLLPRAMCPGAAHPGVCFGAPGNETIYYPQQGADKSTMAENQYRLNDLHHYAHQQFESVYSTVQKFTKKYICITLKEPI